MNTNHLKYSMTATLLATPFLCKANMIWPSIYIVEQYLTWYVIIAGLIIETAAARHFLKTQWLKSFLIMLAANAISAIVGIVLIPFSGIIVELLTIPFGGGTFDISHWILDYIFAILCNTCIEGLALKLIFKYKFKPNFWWLFAANALSIIICIISLLLLPH